MSLVSRLDICAENFLSYGESIYFYVGCGYLHLKFCMPGSMYRVYTKGHKR